jgi:hypothetical protein
VQTVCSNRGHGHVGDTGGRPPACVSGIGDEYVQRLRDFFELASLEELFEPAATAGAHVKM